MGDSADAQAPVAEDNEIAEDIKPESEPENGDNKQDMEVAEEEKDVEDAKGTDVDNGKEKETDQAPVIKAAPQSRGSVELHPQSSLDDLEDCKLTPLDERQSIRDALDGKELPKPSLMDSAINAVKSVVNPKQNDANHVHFSEDVKNNHQSSLHADDYTNHQNSPHNPNEHESALHSDPPGGGSGNSMLNKLRRKTNRLTPGQGKKSHSHPRKSPYKSEIAKLREQQRIEREKGKTSISKSVGIAATTAPPESASFAIQAEKVKHSILQSLGEFLTGAFADDEETSGSYFSQDLLDQISSNDPTVKGVWLQAKSLNDTHVKQLCEALIRNKIVTEVWLPANLITDVGAGYIAHMLKFNHSIKELFLGKNEIGPKGAAALASALARGNSTLVALGLGDNHIGVEGAGAFAAALRHNHTLSSLDIKNNDIPRYSSIRGLLHKMLEFNAADPGDDSLVIGLQEELTSLITNLPSDMAEDIVLQAEEALKTAMLCRKRGDVVGAAEAEGIFIRICTTGEAPVDPPSEEGPPAHHHPKARPPKSKKKKKQQSQKQSEPDRLDELNDELKTLQYNDESKQQPSEENAQVEEKSFEEVSKEASGNSEDAVPNESIPESMKENEEAVGNENTINDTTNNDTN